jgi:predicted ribosomally synthesized six-cysteine peptide SCIFF
VITFLGSIGIALAVRPPATGRVKVCFEELSMMKRIITIKTRDLTKSLKDGGCGECQTSCQSACKTSCGVTNQPCEKSESK